MLMRSYVVGVGLAALTLAFNESMLMGSYVVGVFSAALALAFNESMLMRSYVVGICLATLANAVGESMLVGKVVLYELGYVTGGCKCKHNCESEDQQKDGFQIFHNFSPFQIFLPTLLYHTCRAV